MNVLSTRIIAELFKAGIDFDHPDIDLIMESIANRNAGDPYFEKIAIGIAQWLSPHNWFEMLVGQFRVGDAQAQWINAMEKHGFVEKRGDSYRATNRLMKYLSKASKHSHVCIPTINRHGETDLIVEIQDGRNPQDLDWDELYEQVYILMDPVGYFLESYHELIHILTGTRGFNLKGSLVDKFILVLEGKLSNYRDILNQMCYGLVELEQDDADSIDMHLEGFCHRVWSPADAGYRYAITESGMRLLSLLEHSKSDEEYTGFSEYSDV